MFQHSDFYHTNEENHWIIGECLVRSVDQSEKDQSLAATNLPNIFWSVEWYEVSPNNCGTLFNHSSVESQGWPESSQSDVGATENGLHKTNFVFMNDLLLVWKYFASTKLGMSQQEWLDGLESPYSYCSQGTWCTNYQCFFCHHVHFLTPAKTQWFWIRYAPFSSSQMKNSTFWGVCEWFFL